MPGSFARFDTVKLLVKKWADIEIKNSSGDTAEEYHARRKGHTMIVNYLLQLGQRRQAYI